jgi:diguanylate cyclase (GGDEF)-like protein
VSDHVTVSLGVATLVPRPVLDPGDLVELADRALYRAKQGGRDRIEVDEPSGPAA